MYIQKNIITSDNKANFNRERQQHYYAMCGQIQTVIYFMIFNYF